MTRPQHGYLGAGTRYFRFWPYPKIAAALVLDSNLGGLSFITGHHIGRCACRQNLLLQRFKHGGR